MANQQASRAIQANRSADRLRGYAGQQRRKRWLRNNPMCVHCLAAGELVLAQEIDHIVSLHAGGVDDETNLQSLCHVCHVAKTLLDMNIKKRTKIGIDGFAIEI